MSYRYESESGTLIVRWRRPKRLPVPPERLKQLREITLRQIREAERRRYGDR